MFGLDADPVVDHQVSELVTIDEDDSLKVA